MIWSNACDYFYFVFSRLTGGFFTHVTYNTILEQQCGIKHPVVINSNDQEIDAVLLENFETEHNMFHGDYNDLYCFQKMSICTEKQCWFCLIRIENDYQKLLQRIECFVDIRKSTRNDEIIQMCSILIKKHPFIIAKLNDELEITINHILNNFIPLSELVRFETLCNSKTGNCSTNTTSVNLICDIDTKLRMFDYLRNVIECKSSELLHKIRTTNSALIDRIEEVNDLKIIWCFWAYCWLKLKQTNFESSGHSLKKFIIKSSAVRMLDYAVSLNDWAEYFYNY